MNFTFTAVSMLLCAIFLLDGTAAADDPIAEYYRTHPRPTVTLINEDPRGDPIRDHEIRATLAVLKYELDRGTWSDLSREDRDDLISYLDDPNLRIVFTGKSTQQAVGTGGQVIDRNTVHVHEDALSYSEGARTHYQHARTILHELCHVYQKRSVMYGWILKERWPEHVEVQLSSGHFEDETISKVSSMLSGSTPATPVVATDELPDMSGPLQQLRASSERSIALAQEAKTLSAAAGGGDPATGTTLVKNGIAGLEESIRTLLGLQRSVDQIRSWMSTLAGDVQTETKAVAPARGGARSESAKACQAALDLKESSSAERRKSLYPVVRDHAMKAAAYAKEAREAMGRARDSLQVLSGEKANAEMTQNLRRTLQTQVEMLRLQVSQTRDLVSARERLLAILAEAQSTEARASGPYQEALQKLSGSGRSEEVERKVAEWRSEVEGLWSHVRLNCSSVKSLAGSVVPETLRQADADLTAVEQRLNDLKSQIDQFTPPDFSVDIVLDAQAAVDAAQVLLELAEEDAKNAELCMRASAERVGQPDPGIITDVGSGWEDAIGGASVTGSSQAGSASSSSAAQAQADALIRTAQAMANAPTCDYRSAIQYMERASSINPADPRIAKDMPRLLNLARQQALAGQLLNQAYGHIQNDDYDAALASLGGIKGGPCERDRAGELIQEIENAKTRIASAGERDRIAEQGRQRRATAGQILDTLIRIQKTATGQVPAPSPSTPGVTGGGSPPVGPNPGDCCSINSSSAPDAVTWGLFLHNAGCKNYLVLGFDKDMTPQEYARISGLKLLGTGSKGQMDAKAREFCRR